MKTFASLLPQQTHLRLPACLLLNIILAFSCNRDSNELAPSKYEDDNKFSETLSLNGVAIVKITFIKKTDEWTNRTDMLIENITAQNITKLGFHVQVCRGETNYDKCDRITSYILAAGDTLRAGKVKSVRLSGDYFFVDGYITNVFLTALNTKVSTPAAADFYEGTAVTFRNQSGSAAVPGIAKSYVQLDGRSNFYISSIEGRAIRYHNISGIIAASGLFSGSMRTDAENSEIGLSGYIINATKLILKPSSKDAVTSNISSIELDLK